MTETTAGRIAFRQEDDFLVGIFTTVEDGGAEVVLAKLHMGAAQANPDRRAAFVALVRGCVGDAFSALTGSLPKFKDLHTPHGRC